MEVLAALKATEVKRAAAADRERERERRDVLRERTVSIELSGKLIPASFVEIKGRRALVEMRVRLERNFQQNRKMTRTEILKNLPQAGES